MWDIMKVAFFHDAPLVYGQDGQVYSTGFTYNIWERYLAVFDSIIVSTRMRVDDSINGSITKNMNLSSGPRVEFKPISKYSKKMDRIFNIKEISVQIRKSLTQSDCAIIRLPSFIGRIACKEAIKMGKPYLIEVVGCAWDALWNHGSITGKILAPYSFLKTRRLISKSKYTIYITKEFLQSRYPSHGRTCICPNVNISCVSSQILDNRIRKIDNKKEQDVIVFGLVGSLDVSYKGHETVIKAFSLLKDRIPNFRIEFLGSGNPARWIKLAKECGIYKHVKFLGVLPSGDPVFNWMDNLDVSLQPSSAEAQGRCIIEAMSRGCPVIASKVGGIVELIDSDWLISSGDYVDLSTKILELINNKKVLKQQATRNFEEAKQYYKENIEFKRKKFLQEYRMYAKTINSSKSSS